MTVPVDLPVSGPAAPLVCLVEVEGGAGVAQQQAQPLLLPHLLQDKTIYYSATSQHLPSYESVSKVKKRLQCSFNEIFLSAFKD